MENLLELGKYIYDNVEDNTDKKVQKITYYAYSWYIAKNNASKDNITNRLIEQHPEAWIHGPVFYDLYMEMTHNKEDFLLRKNI